MQRSIPAEGDSVFPGANSPGYFDCHQIVLWTLSAFVPGSFGPSALSRVWFFSWFPQTRPSAAQKTSYTSISASPVVLFTPDTFTV